MTTTRAQEAKQLVPGLNAIFGLNYKEIANEHTVLFDSETSERAFEEEVLMSSFATAPTKFEGAAVQYDDAQELWTARYQHETVALAFGITEEAMEDNLYDTLAKIKAKGLARAMANTKQIKAANVFNFGFNTSYPGGDNKPLFSTTHPTLSAGDLSNSVSVDLSESALEDAAITVSLLKDDRGVLIGSMVKSLHIPPQLQFVAARILESPGQYNETKNNINAMRAMGTYPGGVHVNHRFTDTNAWFVRTDVPNGTKMFTRVKLSTKMEGDFDTGNMRYKARERYSFGWSDWRQWYGSQGAT